MAGLMKTRDAMTEQLQAVAKAMSDAAREVMREHGFAPKNDDRAAIFDEACAVFLSHSLPTSGTPYANETNEQLVARLEFDDGNMDAVITEIRFRERLGGWVSWDEQQEIIRRLNPAFAA